MVDVELTALEGRAGPEGFTQVPDRGPDAGQSGLDHYASAAGGTSLGLLFLALAADQVDDGPRAPLPAERVGSQWVDRQASGTVAVRLGRLWLGVHLRRDRHDDNRQDLGVMRALAQQPDGRWRALRPQAAAPTGLQLPRAAPRLGAAAAKTVSVGISEVSLTIGLRWGRHSGLWRFGDHDGQLESFLRCPAGRRVRWTEWLPAGPAVIRPRRLSAGGYVVRSNRPLQIKTLRARFAAARTPALTGYALSTRCAEHAVRLRYSGRAVASG